MTRRAMMPAASSLNPVSRNGELVPCAASYVASATRMTLPAAFTESISALSDSAPDQVVAP